VKVAEYGPSRRADVADLMARVWGERPAETELEWFYERNPVRPASVLLAEEDGRVVGSAAISYQPFRGDLVGWAVHLATDPAYRGRGIFSELQSANEERARAAGVSLLLTVPTSDSARVLTGKLGWTQLPESVRLWARPWLPARLGIRRMARFGEPWLDWRFADSPRDYALLAGRGSAVVRGRGRLFLAIPSRGQRGRYLRAGFVPTPKTFTALGKSLDGSPLPERVSLQIGDLDFI
jgi:GNAT superfamily N-acetyltransferase